MMLSKWEARMVVNVTPYGFSTLMATLNTIVKNQPPCPTNSICFATDISAVNPLGNPVAY